MKIKVEEATPLQLDWLVAELEDYPVQRPESGQIYIYTKAFGNRFSPSRDWAQGGPIIERERVTIWNNEVWWHAAYNDGTDDLYGSTPLIAAMRCYVASKLGDEVDIPEELCQY